MSDSPRGQKSIQKNAATGPINLSGVTFKDFGRTNSNAEEEVDATSFNHSMLDDDDLSYDDETKYEYETDDDSDDEGKFTSRREFRMWCLQQRSKLIRISQHNCCLQNKRHSRRRGGRAPRDIG